MRLCHEFFGRAANSVVNTVRQTACYSKSEWFFTPILRRNTKSIPRVQYFIGE